MTADVRKRRPLLGAIVTGGMVLLAGSVMPIWPVLCFEGLRGSPVVASFPLSDSLLWMSRQYPGLTRDELLRGYGSLPPMLGGLVFLTGLTGVLTYRWVAARRADAEDGR